jgi:Pyruvate/2-oxoacid:ferredoxin oxidoreductase gamma subunit
VLEENDRPEYAHEYYRRLDADAERAAGKGYALEPRFAASLDARKKVVIAGAAGGKVRSTGHLLGRGAVLSGLYATQRDDYPVTVMTGHSVCEVNLDGTPIGYTGITRPDVLVWVAEESRAKATARLAAMTAADRAYVAHDLLPVETEAQVIPLEFAELDFRVRRQNRAILALGAVLRREQWYPFEALEEAVTKTQRTEIAKLNLAALEASAGLL